MLERMRWFPQKSFLNITLILNLKGVLQKQSCLAQFQIIYHAQSMLICIHLMNIH
jgi:hypothetical protein